jgi:hypothetical protein
MNISWCEVALKIPSVPDNSDGDQPCGVPVDDAGNIASLVNTAWKAPYHLHTFSIPSAHGRVAVLGDWAKACRGHQWHGLASAGGAFRLKSNPRERYLSL